MRIALLVAVVLVLGLIAVWGAGALLPRDHRASVTVDLPVPPTDAWRLVRDLGSSAAWREGVKQVQRVADRPAEAYAESNRFGVLNYVVETEQAPSRLVTRIIDNTDFGGTWTYELEAREAGEQTKLTITEDGEIYNPMFRFFARFVFGYHRTLEAYARDIKAAVTAPR